VSPATSAEERAEPPFWRAVYHREADQDRMHIGGYVHARLAPTSASLRVTVCWSLQGSGAARTGPTGIGATAQSALSASSKRRRCSRARTFVYRLRHDRHAAN